MGTYIKGIPIDDVIAKYKELGNVWKVGEYFGISGQTIHARLRAVGVVATINIFSEEERKILRDKYLRYKQLGRLQELADELGRTKQFICRKARELGLTGGVRHYNYTDDKRAQLSEAAKRRIAKYGHPKGALGMKQPESAKTRIREAMKSHWALHRERWCNEQNRKARSDRMMQYYDSGALGVRSRCYLLDVMIGGKSFKAKSTWEYDIALYLEYLKQRGLISDWGYETVVFRFKYNQLGVRTYRPDFTVIRGERVNYLEVKGWEDLKFSIKRTLMQSEFPNARIIYIKAREYRMLAKKYSKSLKGWGTMKALCGVGPSKCGIDGCEKSIYARGLCRHHYVQYRNNNSQTH